MNERMKRTLQSSLVSRDSWVSTGRSHANMCTYLDRLSLRFSNMTWRHLYRKGMSESIQDLQVNAVSLGFKCNPCLILLSISSGQLSSSLCWIMESTEAKVRPTLRSGFFVLNLFYMHTNYSLNCWLCTRDEDEEGCWIKMCKHAVIFENESWLKLHVQS